MLSYDIFKALGLIKKRNPVSNSAIRTRKIFHIAIVLVYWSGLQYCHLFLLISTYAALFLMIFVEYIRVSKLFPPVSRYLTQKLTPFLDAKVKYLTQGWLGNTQPG